MFSKSVALAQVMLFEHGNFGGQAITASDSISDFSDLVVNDRASSVSVRRGSWQFCGDAYFQGRCVTLGPGEYRTLRLRGMNDGVWSVREPGWTPDGNCGWGGSADSPPIVDGSPPPVAVGGGDGCPRAILQAAGLGGSEASAVLFSGPGSRGEAFVIGSTGLRNLNETGFNDRAQSMRVESGYWVFCTDSNFNRDCRTCGPGDCLVLHGGQRRSILSGRQITYHYPDRGEPRWNNWAFLALPCVNSSVVGARGAASARRALERSAAATPSQRCERSFAFCASMRSRACNQSAGAHSRSA